MSMTVSLLKVMKRYSCKNIVFASSREVYGDNKFCKETDMLHPTSIRGKNKAQIEEFLRNYSEANPDFSAICLRYFNVSGLHPTLRLHDDAESPDLNSAETYEALEMSPPDLEKVTPRSSWEGNTLSKSLNRMSVLGVPRSIKSPLLDKLGGNSYSPNTPARLIEEIDLTAPKQDLMS